MKNTFVKLGAVAALAVGLLAQSILPAAAGEVQDRIEMQQHRIHAGLRSGQINYRQAHRDERRLTYLRRERNWELRRNGGRLTPGEYHRLNRQLDRNSRDIYDQRH